MIKMNLWKVFVYNSLLGTLNVKEGSYLNCGFSTSNQLFKCLKRVLKTLDLIVFSAVNTYIDNSLPLIISFR